MNSSHGHTGAKWGKSRMSPTYMAWNNAQSKYAKVPLYDSWRGPGGFKNFLEAVGEKPAGAQLAFDSELQGFYWRANPTSRKQSAATPEVSGSADSPH